MASSETGANQRNSESSFNYPRYSDQLVGRDRELLAAVHACLRAPDGEGQLVLISGEAGMGKSTLTRVIGHELARSGMLVLQGACYDLTTTPPYGPWFDALTDYEASDGLPSLPAFMVDSDALASLPSQGALVEETLTFLLDLASRQPLVVILEDIHWSDGPSLDLLRVVARTIQNHRIAVVVTYRDDEITRDHPMYVLLPHLMRESPAERVELRPLVHHDTRTLVQQYYPLPEPDLERLIDFLERRAEGNPLFINESLRQLELQGILRQHGSHWRLDSLDGTSVPTLIHQMVEGRLARVSRPTVTAIQTAAVIGQTVPMQFWEALLDDDTIIRALDELGPAGLLEVSPASQTISFRHALLREAVHEGIPIPKRRELHLQAAGIYLAQASPDPDTVAYHLTLAGDPRAAEWLILAGEDAERRFAWREAFIRYNRALDTLRGEVGDERQIAGLTLKTARLLRYFDPERGNRFLEAARQSALSCGDEAVAALALFNMGNNLCVLEDARRGLRLMRDAVEALAAALVDATPDDIARLIRWSGTAVAVQGHPLKRINGTLVPLLAAFGRYREAISTAERYLEVDWRTAAIDDQYSSVARATTFNMDGYQGLGMALSALGRPEEAKLAFDLAQEILQMMNYTPYRLLVASMELIHLHFPYRTANLRERTELVQLIEEAIQPSRGMTDDGNSLWGYEHYLFYEGRWDELRLTIQRNDLPTNSYYRSTCLCVRARLAWAQGHTDLAWKLIHRILPNGVGTEFDEQGHSIAIETQRLAAEMTREAGDYDLAREWVTTLDDWLAWNGAVLGRANGMLIWARIHFDEGDTESAVTVARNALEQASNPEQPLALIGIHRFLGELALDSEDLDSAETHLCISLELAEACRIPFQRALTLISLAELHLARDDRDETLSLLIEVRKICTELGAKPTLDRAERLATSLSRTHAESPYGLTSREIEVLALVVQGFTDRQIAEQLFISHRTVMRHVTHILRKLDVGSRTAAAAKSVRDGLV